jgi:hypothetical protein
MQRLVVVLQDRLTRRTSAVCEALNGANRGNARGRPGVSIVCGTTGCPGCPHLRQLLDRSGPGRVGRRNQLASRVYHVSRNHPIRAGCGNHECTRLSIRPFSLGNFYKRRILRIIPALFVMFLASSVLAYVYCLPVELEDYARSLASAICAVLGTSPRRCCRSCYVTANGSSANGPRAVRSISGSTKATSARSSICPEPPDRACCDERTDNDGRKTRRTGGCPPGRLPDRAARRLAAGRSGLGRL